MKILQDMQRNNNKKCDPDTAGCGALGGGKTFSIRNSFKDQIRDFKSAT